MTSFSEFDRLGYTFSAPVTPIELDEKDLDEFIESLSTEQFTLLIKFFETMPRLRHRIEVTNPKTEVTSEVMLEGIESFLE